MIINEIQNYRPQGTLPMESYHALNLEELITKLNLQPHDEGGWFCRTYESNTIVKCNDRLGIERPSMTTIHYVLGGSARVTLLHCNRSDIVHFHEAGCAFRYVLLYPDGSLETTLLGPGGRPQLIVPGGVYKACEVVSDDWGMIGEAVSPGFDYRDRTLMSEEKLANLFPQYINRLQRYIP
ncbi:MAG: cupin domain-containing protein [Gammaproteobacteria bacterium]|nr:cupin domain-containing protein [Gammaproteobacteria bacterium]